MKRRKIIKLSAFVTGGALMSNLLPGCKTDTLEIDIDGYSPSLLSSNQYKFIRDLSDTLLPETDTPGAISVGLPQIYDSILSNIMTEDQKTKYSEKLSGLMKTVVAENNGNDLSSLASEDRLSFITKLDNTFSTADNPSSQSYKEVKSRLINFYLNTEEVGTKLLNYLPVPGEYQACITLEEAGGKAWAL